MRNKEIIVNGCKYCPTKNHYVPVTGFYLCKRKNGHKYSVNCIDCHKKYHGCVDGFSELFPSKVADYFNERK